MEVKTVLCRFVRCVAVFCVIIASVFIVLAIMKDMEIYDINHGDTPTIYELSDSEKLYILESMKSD